MADFRPFKAWRYNPKNTDASFVIAPPYDVISPEAQEKLYQKSPHNCVRLILNKKEDSDNSSHNVYTRAKHFFHEWQKEKILIREEVPSFYLYRQTFPDPVTGLSKTRTAVLGRLKLEPFDKGIVIAHEKTLAKPKEDRRKLLEMTETNFSPIFGLYDDPKGEIILGSLAVTQEAPLYEAIDEDQVNHKLWKIADEKRVHQIEEGFKEKKIYIADGHHRYQTSLDYALEKRTRDHVPAGVEVPSDFGLIALVEFRDPGLVLMPTHRILLPIQDFDNAAALKALEDYFDVTPSTVPQILEALSTDSQKFSSADFLKKRPVIGLVLGKEKAFLLTAKNLEKAKELIGLKKPEIWYHLDVALISHLILAKLWGIHEGQWEADLRYTHSQEVALKQITEGKAQAIFLLESPPVEILREMGNVKELMPQKSTYFYPKLASGLLFHEHRA